MTGEHDESAHSTDSAASSNAPRMDETLIQSHETFASSDQSSAGSESFDGWVGTSLQKYVVTQVLGKGGMGVVLKAHDPLIDRDVAIKVLADHLASDPTALSRFLSEARTAGQLNHPNVAAIYDVGQEGNLHFLVMELVTGGSLDERVEKQGALSLLEATRAMVDACKGIIAAHSAGLIHRDIKPANFLRTPDGSIKVADFGLAKASTRQSQQMTQVGTVIGTPFFMSPEQCQGTAVDVRSDVYSLGATYYSLLTGKYPYHDSASVPQVMYAHCHADIPDPRTEDDSIPLACSRIIAKAMAKDPDQRYQTVKEMLADLEMVHSTLSGQTLAALPSESGSHAALSSSGFSPVVAGPPPHRSRIATLAGGAAFLAVLAAAGIWWTSRERAESTPDDAAAGVAAAVEPIRVGVLHSLSGTMAESESVVVDATLFAIDEVNQAGGVMGRPLKAVVADGRSDPDVFAREAERLITEEGVCTIFGCWTSASRKAVKAVVEEHDHLLVYPLQYEGLETSPNVIYMGASPNQQILPAVEWAFTSLAKKRFYLVGSDYVFPRAANAIIKDELQRLGGEVVGEAYVPLGGAEVKAIVEDVAATKPDMILNTINGDSNSAFFRELRQVQIESQACPTMSFSVGEAGLRHLSSASVAGDYAAWTYFQSIDTPVNEEFVSRFRERYPQRVITDPMESAYVGVEAWARAANEVENVAPRKLRHAVLEQRFAAPDGELRFDTETHHCDKTPRIGQIQADGQIEIVWTADRPVRPDPFPDTRTATEWLAFLHDLHKGWGNRWSAPEKTGKH